MFYKIDDEYGVWRYWCDCTDPSHALEFAQNDPFEPDNGLMTISVISRPNMTIWRRIKDAFKILFGKEVCYMDICISKEDRKELGRMIAGTKPD